MTELNLHPKILAIKQAVDALKFGRASVWERSAKDTLKAAYQDASDNMVDDDAPWCEDCGKPERWGFALVECSACGKALCPEHTYECPDCQRPLCGDCECSFVHEREPEEIDDPEKIRTKRDLGLQ